MTASFTLRCNAWQGAGPLARLAGGHRKTASLTEAGPEIESKPAGSGRRRHRRKKKVQKQSAAMQRKLRFEHVRINRVILRTTFQVPRCLGRWAHSSSCKTSEQQC